MEKISFEVAFSAFLQQIKSKPDLRKFKTQISDNNNSQKLQVTIVKTTVLKNCRFVGALFCASWCPYSQVWVQILTSLKGDLNDSSKLQMELNTDPMVSSQLYDKQQFELVLFPLQETDNLKPLLEQMNCDEQIYMMNPKINQDVYKRLMQDFNPNSMVPQLVVFNEEGKRLGSNEDLLSKFLELKDPKEILKKLERLDQQLPRPNFI